MELPSSSSSLSNYKEWTKEQNEIFERCVAREIVNNELEPWDLISNFFFGGKKTPEEVKNHYDKLLHDLNEIENGRVCLPKYKDDDNYEDYDNGHDNFVRKKTNKYIQWSKDEHRLFLIGEKIYGEGSWKYISKMVVKSRSAGQVASHAQKFQHRKIKPKNTKRASIHDITTVDHATALDFYQRGLISEETYQSYMEKLAQDH